MLGFTFSFSHFSVPPNTHMLSLSDITKSYTGTGMNLLLEGEKETDVLHLKHAAMAYISKGRHTKMYVHLMQNTNRRTMVHDSL